MIKEHPTIESDEIDFDGTILGEGKYGIVKKGICRGCAVAVKFIRVTNKRSIKKFKEEIQVLSTIRAPNVCVFLGACTLKDDDDELYVDNEVCIVQEYLSGGDLGKILQNKNLPTNIVRRLLWGKDIAMGMRWIHGVNIFHRDLKLENLLLDAHGEIKVCDFGLSHFCPEGESIVGQDVRGTPLYSAPEVFLKNEITKKVDVYSFGFVLWELLAKQRVFPHHHNREIFIKCICGSIQNNHEDGERPPVPPPKIDLTQEEKKKEEQTKPDFKYDLAWNNEDLVKLLKDCWGYDYNSRPDFGGIYEKLNSIILNLCFGNDMLGKEFWRNNFQFDFEVPYEKFFKELSNNIKTIQEKEIECLKRILGQFEDDYTHVRGDTKVTQEIFGNLLTWFGPYENEHGTFLTRMVEICSNPWFHGNISSEAANNLLLLTSNQLQTNDIFLVRFSVKPGCFTVQTKKFRFLIFRENGQYILQGKDYGYPSLELLVENSIFTMYPNFSPCTYFPEIITCYIDIDEIKRTNK